MTTENVQFAFAPPGLWHRIDTYFASIGLGFNAAGLRRTRLRQVIALEAKSDRDLARMGLRREDIPAHVFRDVLGG